MSSKLRALTAALIVVAVALTGALYLGYRSGLQAAQSTNSDISHDVASVDLQSFLGPGSPDERLVSLAFRRVEETFYKPINPQTLLDGERQGLKALLDQRHLNTSILPRNTASGDSVQDKVHINSELAFAEKHFGARVGNVDLTQSAIRGMMDSLRDPYTVYLSPREIQGLNESLNGGNFGGIGVYIVQDPKTGDVLVDPIERLPAARAGMKPGDIVDAVDGHVTKGLKLDAVERLIRGPAGSTVRLQTHPYKKKSRRSFTIVRETIHVPTVKAKMEDQNTVDYIRLSDFGETSADEIKKALLFGKAHHAKSYVLDLRNNGGGLLEAAVQISSYFVPHGPIVSTINRQGAKDTANASGEAIDTLTPLVILVNKYTASASEITAGALQDYKLARLVGTKTFGKGVVQSIYPLPDSGALKITTARYVTPLGRDIQHKGIDPDLVVNQSPDPALIDTPKDQQLAAAKTLLKRMAPR
ncbi:MAG: S41 family peptidase [Candidatus Eremiobacteraeota bacterium]|nr:S41 family peptidase [Candidatus Eremiobacteraeota bacterium]